MTETDKEILLKEMSRIEDSLIKTRDRLMYLEKDNSTKNRDVFYLYSQLSALTYLCDLYGIDRSEYNWIHNIPA